MKLHNLFENSRKSRILKCSEYLVLFENLKDDTNYFYILNDDFIFLPEIIDDKKHTFYHNTMNKNEDCQCAGECMKNNNIITVNNLSGHYKPKPEDLDSCSDLLRIKYPEFIFKLEYF